jgi:hypothetical protein
LLYVLTAPSRRAAVSERVVERDPYR